MSTLARSEVPGLFKIQLVVVSGWKRERERKRERRLEIARTFIGNLAFTLG